MSAFDPAALNAPAHLFDALGSTNAEAMRLAATTPAPFWVLARQQVAGQGRRGRPWATPPGNFAASLMLRLPIRGPSPALRSFTAALALVEALEVVAGRALPLSLKWPNDVLIEGRKLAGILLEGRSGTGPGAGATGNEIDLVIGIGVNLIVTPPADALEPGALAPVSLLEATGLKVAPEALLAALDGALFRREAELVTEGFAPLRADWLARAHGLGQPLIARLADGSEAHGTFETVDLGGNLVLKTGHARRAIPAADIFFA